MTAPTRPNAMWIALLVVMGLLTGGCDWTKTDSSRLLSPEKVIKAPPEATPVKAIRLSIGAADQTDDLIPNASLPTPADAEYSDQDYIIGPGDVLNVTILDLYGDGRTAALQKQVTESGYIDLPLLRSRILAEGLTQEELVDVVADAYRQDLIKDPVVEVQIIQKRQNSFSILGAVARPGPYPVTRPDMRLLEALAAASGITQSNIRYIYIIRQPPPKRSDAPKRKRPERAKVPPPPPREVEPQTTVPAGAGANTGGSGGEETGPAGGPGDGPFSDAAGGEIDLEALQELGEAFEQEEDTNPAVVPMMSEATSVDYGPPIQPPATSQPREARKGRYKWIRRPGEGWVRVYEQAETAQADPQAPPEDPFRWKQTSREGGGRIIAIDLNQLRNGVRRMNIVIRDRDVIHVPGLEIGEFYIGGEVNRPGVYSLTGRRVTIKMAIAASGNFGALAWPENSILVRRVGYAEEQIIPLNLEKIFRGEEEDLFLKPNDLIEVGTNARSTFFAVIRNAFRLTYGFGFIYDRNFYEPELFTYRGLTSERFKRW